MLLLPIKKGANWSLLKETINLWKLVTSVEHCVFEVFIVTHFYYKNSIVGKKLLQSNQVKRSRR